MSEALRARRRSRRASTTQNLGACTGRARAKPIEAAADGRLFLSLVRKVETGRCAEHYRSRNPSGVVAVRGVIAAVFGVNMTDPTRAPDSVRAQIADTLTAKEYVVRRDGSRPLSFAGVRIAYAKTQSIHRLTFEAAVYRTVGGKFIATFVRDEGESLVSLASLLDVRGGEIAPDEQSNLGAPPASRSLNKAAVFENVEDAGGWFRPGKLTDSIRKQLGLDDPIRIE